jgi:hypothetical protein
MRLLSSYVAIVAVLAVSSTVSFAREMEKVRNDKVAAWEDELGAGESASASTGKPALLLYLTEGALTLVPKDGTPAKVDAKPGTVRFDATGFREIRNSSSSPVRFLRVEFNNAGSAGQLGRSGLSPHYQVLLENKLVRVYDIFIPAKSNEPQHTHKDRIVVCLAGAELTHLFPDGRTEVSSLKTGQVAWRKGSTHIGQNHSANDFHAIAIEPK